MTVWTDRRVLDLLHVSQPLLLAPMAGSGLADLAIAVAKAGGLGAIPCSSISVEKVTAEVERFRAAIDAPVNLNFFAHTPIAPTDEDMQRWLSRLEPYFKEFAVDTSAIAAAGAVLRSTTPCARWWSECGRKWSVFTSACRIRRC